MGVRDISGAGATDAQVLETVQSDGTFEFQQATDISTSTGNLTLSPSSGLIGVGTASPSTALHVKSETGDTAVKVQAGSASDTDGAAQVTFADWQRSASIGLMSTDIIIAKDSSIDPLSDNRRVTINVDSGNVGIGHGFGQHRPPDGSASASVLNVENTTTSGSAQGGNLRLGSNDGAVMGSGHRLGVIEFAGSEAASPGPAGSAMAVGARIESVTDDTWSTTENGANLDFYTTDGDAVQTKRMTILADGNVGIGPTAPTKNLHVSKSSGEATFRLQSAGYYSDIIQTGANLFIQNAAGGGNIIFYDDAAERMRIDTDGNVGIGDNAPGTQLQMKGTAPYVTLKNSTAENIAGGCESKIVFEDHGDNALGQIEVSHVGTSDDEKGQLILSTNNDSGLQTALTIDEDQTATFAGNATFGVDDTGVDVRLYSATASEGVLYDASEDELALLLTTKLKFHDVGGGEEIYASADGHLEINAGTKVDVTAGSTIDLNASTCTIDAATLMREKVTIDIPSRSGTPATDGSMFHIEGGATFTDSNTSGSATVASFNMMDIEATTLAATNSSVTTTDASTLYIGAAPTAGTNQTLTNAWALYSNGATKIGGKTVITGDTGGFMAEIINDGDHVSRKGLKVQCGVDDPSSSTNVYVLCNDGDGGASGQLQDASGTFSAADTSDRRLKEDIVDTAMAGLDIINAMQVRDFKWKKSGLETTGFIAQEMQAAFPMAACGDDTGDEKTDPMMIMRDIMVIPLVKAVQELSAQVEALKNN